MLTRTKLESFIKKKRKRNLRDCRSNEKEGKNKARRSKLKQDQSRISNLETKKSEKAYIKTSKLEKETKLNKSYKQNKATKLQKYKNSVISSVNSTKLPPLNLEQETKDNIKMCPTIYATEEDFKNPISFLENLWNSSNDSNSTGIIKIIPPKNWKMVNSYIFKNFYYPNFVKSEKKIETRIQNLIDLTKGKKFEFVRNYTFMEYKQKSENIEKEIIKKKKGSLEEIEKEYWKICSNSIANNTHSTPNYKEYKVHYAADLSYNTFLTKSEFTKINSYLKSENSWNMSSLYKEKDSFFQFLTNKPNDHISGLTIPWVYFGMLYSTFCWHVEDLYMYSVNYMYHGGPKIWYGVPHNQKEKLDELLKSKTTDHDPNILHKLRLLVDPQELIEKGITVYKAVQNPGEIIFTLPKSYHCGFSTGFNISEAVNLATYKWTDFGLQACQDYNESLSKTPVFPIEWLIHNLMKDVKNYQFTNKIEFEKIPDRFKAFIQVEKNKRQTIENFLKIHKINYQIFNLKEKENDTINECNICTNLGYFSFKKCLSCNFITCMDHKELCQCRDPIWILYYRKMDEDLLNRINNK